MSSPLKDYFHYSKSERIGAITLLLILGVVFLYYLYIQFRPVEVSTTENQFDVEIVKYKKGSNTYNSNSKKGKYDKKSKPTLFKFNPNEIDTEDWKKLGFSQKQAESIEKYKNAGATFKKKSDLKKLFMVDDSKYEELEPFIDLPETNNADNKEYPYSKETNIATPSNKIYFGFVLASAAKPIYSGFEKYTENVYYHKEANTYTYVIIAGNSVGEAMELQSKYNLESSDQLILNSLKGYYPVKKDTESKFPKLEPFDFNTADTTQLKKISGIGSSFAKRIIEQRNSLGGFLYAEQLLEVYGFTPEMFDKVNPFMLIDTSEIIKININTCEITDLKNHPYLSWNVANSIVQIRKNYGDYKKVADIKKSDLINAELFRKIAPYIKTE